MKRRTFLSRLSIAVGAALTYSFADQHQGDNEHAGHMQNMPAMDHSNMQNMQGMMQGPDLLPTSALPTKQPLPVLKRLKNTTQEPNLFRAELQVKSAQLSLTKDVSTEFWTYNGQVPGPAIEVFEGDTLEITVNNALAQETTIHWHGLPVPPAQDGNPQDPIAAGKSKVYRFTLPEDCAGTYWYHPHGHGTVAEQVFRGLAGVLIVKSKNDPLKDLPIQEWLISDLRLDTKGQIPENTMMDWMNGREGQFVLINGTFQPTIQLETATRVRIWNACSGRYLHLALADTDWQLVGTDGGLLAKPHAIQTILLSPGERAEIVITPRKTGSQPLQALAYDRGKMGAVAKEETKALATVALKDSAVPQLPTVLRNLPAWGEVAARKQLEYSEIMGQGRPKFLINGKSHDPKRVDLTSKAGEIEEWLIFNNSHMDHNFHLHGTQFELISHELEGKLQMATYRALKDTVNLRPYEKIVIRTVQKQKGLRMYHCHILEHETLGMMGQLEVI